MIARSIFNGINTLPYSARDGMVEYALGGLFKDNCILAREVKTLRDGVFEVSFIFPKYQRTVDALGHVSANQINEAIIEGMNCAIAQAIADGMFPLGVNLEWYREHWADWIVSRQFVEYRKMLDPFRPVSLSYSLLAVEHKVFRREFYRVTMGLDGFVRGEVDWLIETKHIHGD
ncbi:MAG: hypothetical protein KDD66_17965 [Bdellovibrionales bacterium]|nr:hypothetical protein [Bdellovibrionales bacterium]